MVEPVALVLPLAGPARTENSPARRVPSHGTHLLGTTDAVDLVPVDPVTLASAPRTWRSLRATEPPEAFVGFGVPVLAPCAGRVVAVHDGEPDQVARRSLPAQLPYALGTRRRLRAGPGAVAGNHVVLRAGDAYVLVAHLRRDGVRVAVGDVVGTDDVLGACGNSGSSTEPHVHVQATTSTDWATTRGRPVVFLDLTRWTRAGPTDREDGMPAEGEVVSRRSAGTGRTGGRAGRA